RLHRPVAAQLIQDARLGERMRRLDQPAAHEPEAAGVEAVEGSEGIDVLGGGHIVDIVKYLSRVCRSCVDLYVKIAVMHGDIAHVAINAGDVDASLRFYAALFGWDFSEYAPGFHRAKLPAGLIAA